MKCKTSLYDASHNNRPWFIFKYAAPVSVFLQSLILGTIVAWPTINIPKLLSTKSPIPLTKEDVSWMTSLLYFGNMLSPIPSGYLTDRYGRKLILLYLSFTPILTWTLVYFGKTRYELWLSWFCAGIWSGVIYTVVPVYLGEVTIPKHRGFVNTMFSTMRRIGMVVQYILGQYLNLKYFMIFIFGLPIMTLCILIFTPESPYYYIMINDKQCAFKSLHQLRGKNNKKVIENELNEIESYIRNELKHSGTFRDLITTKTNRKTLFIIETIIILVRIPETGCIMGYIIATLPSHIFNFLDPSHCMMIIEIFRLLSSCVSSFIIDSLSRKFLLITTSIISGISMFIIGIWYYININTQINVTSLNWLPFLCLLTHTLSYCLGMGPVSSSLRSEYFPLSVKTKSNAIVSTTIAFVSCIVNKMFFIMADILGIYFNYLIFAFSCLINAVFTAIFVIETKGKTLKEIQDELNATHCTNNSSKVVDNV